MPRTNPATPASALTLLSDREIVMRRIFDAPRELVFKAYTDPAMIPRWWGPRGYTTTIEKMDLRPGGAWRFVQRDPAGQIFVFHGEYREITPPERLVSTFEYEGTPGQVVLNTAVFEDQGGRTRLTTTSLFRNRADRDGMISAGMERGATESMDRLAELLAQR
ncbi:MAG TPA: SRPBCC family protein [Gemmatimonadales bacterium]|nr:SRPBCC family protein [Gemmatimonadales bacterium]